VLNFSFDRLFGFDPNSESGTAEPTLDNSYGPVAISTPSGSLVSDNLVNFIKVKEGFRAELYEDSGGVPTIGFGTTSGPLLQKGIVTEEEATAALLEEINQKALEVKNQLDADGITLSQNEFDALVSFAYNAGSNALINKTQIYSKIKEGLRGEELRPYFNTYIKDNKGNVLEGLITRRKEEASIFIDGKAAGYASGGNGLKAPAHIENTPSGGILTRAKSNSAKPNIMGGFGLDSKALRQSLGSGFGKADNEMRKYRTTNTNVMGGNGKTISSKVSKTTKASNNNILPYKSDSSLTNVSANNSVTIELIKSIINVLIKISSNTDNLQKIVELLANVLDVKIPKEQIQNVKTSTGKQDLTNLLSSSVNNNTIDNSSLLQILNALASE
jgi:GH24 family phage-related lysozyme (muramidase)